MALYTRRQLVLLFVLLGAGAAGLGIQHWRARHPDAAARLEALDGELVRRLGGDTGASAGVTAPAGERPGSAASDRAPRPEAAPAAGPPAPEPRGPVDLNRASIEQLATLPGIGPALARRIAGTRSAHGGFASVDDLARVPGVGRARLERVRPFVLVSDRDPGAHPADERAPAGP